MKQFAIFEQTRNAGYRLDHRSCRPRALRLCVTLSASWLSDRLGEIPADQPFDFKGSEHLRRHHGVGMGVFGEVALATGTSDLGQGSWRPTVRTGRVSSQRLKAPAALPAKSW